MLFMAGIAMLGDISPAAWPGENIACDVDVLQWTGLSTVRKDEGEGEMGRSGNEQQSINGGG